MIVHVPVPAERSLSHMTLEAVRRPKNHCKARDRQYNAVGRQCPLPGTSKQAIRGDKDNLSNGPAALVNRALGLTTTAWLQSSLLYCPVRLCGFHFLLTDSSARTHMAASDIRSTVILLLQHAEVRPTLPAVPSF